MQRKRKKRRGNFVHYVTHCQQSFSDAFCMQSIDSEQKQELREQEEARSRTWNVVCRLLFWRRWKAMRNLFVADSADTHISSSLVLNDLRVRCRVLRSFIYITANITGIGHRCDTRHQLIDTVNKSSMCGHRVTLRPLPVLFPVLRLQRTAQPLFLHRFSFFVYLLSSLCCFVTENIFSLFSLHRFRGTLSPSLSIWTPLFCFILKMHANAYAMFTSIVARFRPYFVSCFCIHFKAQKWDGRRAEAIANNMFLNGH